MVHPRLRWFLLMVLVAVPFRVARADATTDQLRQAAERAQDGAWDEAIEAVPSVSSLNRSHVPLLWQVEGALQEARPSAAAHLLAAIRRLDPEASRPRIALESFWTDHPAPGTLYPDDLWLFPVDAEVLTLKASDSVPGGLPGASVATVSPRDFLPMRPATEPRSGRSYNRAVMVYTDRREALALRFVVHYTGEVEEARARQAGRFLGALSLLTGRILGGAGRAAYPMHVWLSPRGEPGAEQWAGSIVIHKADAARSNLEWARELAHEWGHATLPGIDGFVEPEAWADGDLGERLFLPKLAAAGWLAAWDKDLDVSAYTRRYVDTLRAAFARTGPVSKLLKDPTRAGFDHFLGAALYVDAAYGTATLAAALQDMEGQRPANFFAAFQRALARKSTWTVARPDGVAGPVATCFPAAGEYILDARSVRRGAPSTTPATPVTGPIRLPAGWTMLDWSGALTVRRLPGRPRTAS